MTTSARPSDTHLLSGKRINLNPAVGVAVPGDLSIGLHLTPNQRTIPEKVFAAEFCGE